jgi:hypothetical protein
MDYGSGRHLGAGVSAGRQGQVAAASSMRALRRPIGRRMWRGRHPEGSAPGGQQHRPGPRRAHQPPDISDIIDVGGGVKYAWFTDPDGNSLTCRRWPGEPAAASEPSRQQSTSETPEEGSSSDTSPRLQRARMTCCMTLFGATAAVRTTMPARTLIRPHRVSFTLREPSSSPFAQAIHSKGGPESRCGAVRFDEVGSLAAAARDTSGRQHSTDAKPCHVAPRDRERRQLGRHAALCRRSR